MVEFYVKIQAYNPEYLINFIKTITFLTPEIWWETEQILRFYRDSREIGWIEFHATEFSAIVHGMELYNNMKHMAPFKTMVNYR